jgi:hypothetical protein
MVGTLRITNSEYEIHQVGSKDFGSQNINFLASIISATAATARDSRKFSIAQIMFFSACKISYKKEVKQKLKP